MGIITFVSSFMALFLTEETDSGKGTVHGAIVHKDAGLAYGSVYGSTYGSAIDLHGVNI